MPDGGAPRDAGWKPAATVASPRLRAPTEASGTSASSMTLGMVLGGRYVLEERLGEGGMGAVFLAHDRELDRRVAVKLLPKSLLHDPEIMGRFETEARATAKLDHPNIVPIYDVGKSAGRPFIVMKRLEGETLESVLRRRGALAAAEVVNLMRQLARGVDFIHQHGFIHRDLKASNIMVGPDGHVTILDFGILRRRDSTTGLTRQGMVMGTPLYMAPEQALGAVDIDHRVDLYALGVILYEVLSGRPPFEAENEMQLVQLQAHAIPPDLVERAPWVPRPVADVIHRALAKRPEERHASAAELAQDLEAALVASGNTSWTLDSASWRKLAPVGGKDSGGVQRAAPMPPMPSFPSLAVSVAAPRPSQRGRWLAALGAVAALTFAAGALWLAFAPPGGAATDDSGGDAQRTVSDAGAPRGGAFLGAGSRRASDTASEAVPDAAGGLAASDGIPDGGAASGQGDGALQAAVAASDDAGTPEDGDVVEILPEDAPLDVRSGSLAVGRGAGTSGSEARSGAAKRGRVRIVTLWKREPYWAEVFVDGVRRGRSPVELELPPGKHVVRVERPGFRPQVRDTVVVAGRTSKVQIVLKP